MEDMIICPNCQQKNSKTSTKCENCGHIFSNETKNGFSENWLDSLRKTGELREVDPPPGDEENSIFETKDDSEAIPDWLKRIQETDNSDTVKHEDLFLDPKEAEEIHVNDQILESDQKEKNDSNYEWLKDFRNYSEVEGKTEDKSDDLNSSDTLDEIVLEEEPLLSIDEIKKDWQNEFPTLSKNLDEEDIAPADDLPEWLNTDIGLEKPELDLSASAEEAMFSEIVQSNQENELPEWLKINGETSKDTLAEVKESDTSIPDWLHSINTSQENPLLDEKLERTDQDSKEDEFMDSDLLFNKLEIHVDTTNDHAKDEEHLDLEKKSPEIEKSESNISTPAFIIEENELPTEKPFLLDDEDAQLFRDSTQFDEEYLSAARNGLEDIEPLSTQNGDVDSVPFSFEDIPDWLEKVRLDELDTDIEKFSQESEEAQPLPEPKIDKTSTNDISKGNLPEWLKAIRPIEVVTPDVSDLKYSKRVEKAGPLAGLKGVLSTEDISSLYTTSSLTAININITEKQKAQAKLLEEIVSPVNLQTTHEHKKSSESNLLSVVIPAIFLLLMIFSLFINQNIFNFPVQIPAETVRFHNILTGFLNQNQTQENILLISEVDASASPEVSLISKSVIENLYLNNHRISYLSTNPNGIIVAKNILENGTLSVPSYNFSDNIINLGYLPANHVGIQSFLSNPQKTIPSNFEGTEIWTSTYLSDLRSITNFDLFILLTDNSEKARLWIEQIELFAPEVGFLVIATTQSTPLLSPYVEANQIDGMIGGITESRAFNSLVNTESEDLSRFTFILQLAVLIIIIFLLSGSLVTIFSNMKTLIHEKKKQ